MAQFTLGGAVGLDVVVVVVVVVDLVAVNGGGVVDVL